MEKIRTVIVDDEPIARRGIRAQLERHKDFEVVAECRNGREAVEAIATYAPDLVFLDVQMPELDGFDALTEVGAEHMPPVIFVTAYDRYATHAFDVHALDYVLKPIDDDRFAKAVERARRQIEKNGLNDLGKRLQNLLNDLRPAHQFVERLVIRSNGRIFFLNLADVHWIEAADNYVEVHVANESHLVRETMSNLEKKLDPNRFLRIHRSRIVNIERIKQIQPLFRGEHEIMLQDGTRLESGRAYRDRILQLIHGR